MSLVSRSHRGTTPAPDAQIQELARLARVSAEIVTRVGWLLVCVLLAALLAG